MDALVIAEGAEIVSPKGSSVSMTVNGAKTPIKAGSYIGKIELRVSPEK
jgi:hypothetical protein